MTGKNRIMTSGISVDFDLISFVDRLLNDNRTNRI